MYYIDSGNPTSPMRVFNPNLYHVTDPEMLLKLAITPNELVWHWARDTAHMFKSWFDINDSWKSTLSNVHNQIRIAEYQSCGRFNTPDMLTIGQGAQAPGEYRSMMFLWAVLGAPLILGNDIRHMDQFVVDLVTSPEVIAVNRDSDCTQGSLARALDATETWVRPLHGGDFAVVLLNKGTTPTNATLIFDRGFGENDFFPAYFTVAEIRDVHARCDLGVFNTTFSIVIPGHDAVLLRVHPTQDL